MIMMSLNGRRVVVVKIDGENGRDEVKKASAAEYHFIAVSMEIRQFVRRVKDPPTKIHITSLLLLS